MIPPPPLPSPVRPALPGSPFTLLARIADHARRRPAAEAFREGSASGRALSYAELATQMAAVAAEIRAVAPRCAALVCCPNRLEFPIAYLGALAADAVVVPVHPRLTGPELAAIAAAVGAAAILGPHGHTPNVPGLTRVGIRAAGPPQTDGMVSSRPAPVLGPTLVLQSSGTTGAPKLAVRSGGSLDAVARTGALVQRLTPDDRVLACIPLSHSYGMENGLLSPLWAGSAVRLLEGFDAPAVLRELRTGGEGGGATVFPGVPFMFEGLALLMGDRPVPGAGSLRLAFSAGSSMPVPVADRFREASGLAVGQLYGATELGLVAFGDPSSSDFDASTVGAAAPGVQIAVLDPADPARVMPPGREGQVAVAAPSMLSAYLHDPVPSAHGLFLTGDLGVLDARGRLRITGRLSLQIDVGGLKVNPAEVERALLEHPGVGECIVLPVRLSGTVQRVRAIVVPRAGAVPPSPDDLRRFAQERLAPHKVPRVFEVRASLPRSPAGKVMRRELEELGEGWGLGEEKA